MTRQSSLSFAASKFPPSPHSRTAKRSYDDAVSVDDDAQMIDLTEDKESTPVFYIEDDDVDDGMDEDDGIRELDAEEIDALGPLFEQLSVSAIPVGYERRDLVLSPLGFTIRPRCCVELESEDFLRVFDILRDNSGETVLRGILFRRNKRVDRYLQRQRNEVCAIITCKNENVANPQIDSSLVLCPLHAAVQMRDLVVTNRPFPELSFRCCETPYYKGQEQLVEDTARLVCRWKFIEYVQGRKVVAGALVALRESEADTGKGVPDAIKRNAWRGNESDHFNARPSKKNRSEVAIDLTDDDLESSNHAAHSGDLSCIAASTANGDQQPAMEVYTYADICAGAGGMSRGAEQAGLQLKYLLDHWDVACRTLRLNFSRAKILDMDIFDFCTKGERQYRVTVLHVSFPCQPYSPANTTGGKRDPENVAAGYSVKMILNRTKPRVVTLEQTFGLLHRHHVSFAALINQLTTERYNVRWRIFNCAQHENAQPRKRLFIIASW